MQIHENQRNSKGYPLHNRCKSVKTNDILRVILCKIGTNPLKSDEIPRDTPCKIGANQLKCMEIPSAISKYSTPDAYPNVSKRIQTYPNVSKRIQKYQNVSKKIAYPQKYNKMNINQVKRIQTYPKPGFCIQNWLRIQNHAYPKSKHSKRLQRDDNKRIQKPHKFWICVSKKSCHSAAEGHQKIMDMRFDL